jgi:hypothetical protein
MSGTRWWCFVMANRTHIGWHRRLATAERELAPLLDVDVLVSAVRSEHSESENASCEWSVNIRKLEICFIRLCASRVSVHKGARISNFGPARAGGMPGML